ncbi:MAG: MlaD family protein [Opitutales bacterium]
MRKPSPTFVGAFVLAALVLFVGMVLFFGSSRLLSRSVEFCLFFDQSVNGLNEGSTVKFRGVPVGSVSKIMIRAEGQDPDSTAIPVLIKIDRSRLENDLGLADTAFGPEAIQATIDRGLYAQLTMESFITGQLFVELSIDRRRSPGLQTHFAEKSELIEIPTLSSSLDEITSDAAEIIARLSEVDFKRVENNLHEVMENLAVVLAGIDSEAMSRSIAGAADSVTELMRSDEVTRTLSSADEALVAMKKTLESLNLESGPLAEKLDQWTGELSTSLEGLDHLSKQLAEMTEPDGSLRFELERMLRELGRAAQSVRVLADYLEANPKAILTGRPEE